MNGHDRYAYRVIWSDEDEMYVGLCAEFGLRSHLDDTPEGTFAGIRDVVAFAVSSLREDGDPVPEPLSTRRYSGTLTLRVPPETHRALAMDAAEAGVSMNRLAVEPEFVTLGVVRWRWVVSDVGVWVWGGCHDAVL